MDAYLTKSFQREAKSDGISDSDCQVAIRRAEKGLVDADLGGGLIKQRIPRSGQGASRGSRAIIFYRRGKVAVFLHCFSKSRKANLTKSELVLYQRAAQEFDRLIENDLGAMDAVKEWRKLRV